MNPQSLLGHCLALLKQIERTRTTPADSLTSTYTRARKYLGSKERRALSEIVFATLRTLNTARYLSFTVIGENTPPELASLLGSVVATAPTWGGTDTISLLTAAAGANADAIEALEHLAINHAPLTLAKGWHEEMIARLHELASIGEPNTRTLALQCCLPDWMVETFLQHTVSPDTIRRLGRELAHAASVVLRITDRSLQTEHIIGQLQKEGIVARPAVYSPDAIVLDQRVQLIHHQLYRNGLVELQDEGSQLVAYALAPEPGWRILDACAGAGGKTLHLASLLGSVGTIIASDIDVRRLRHLSSRLHRYHYPTVRIEPLLSRQAQVPRSLHHYFDAVLLDVPCSGTGTLRRAPEIKWRLSLAQVHRFARKQQQILETYSPCLRSGGVLVYATCSLLYEENERIVEEFLDRHPEFVPDPLSTVMARHNIKLPLEPSQWWVRLTPHEHGTDGFFIARLRRR